ncbi:MAG: hypothetical protein CMJ83_08510 [Planctomycetes bacterium]|nr:hypothetical protein [Planctomycetota bacterium]
MSGPSDDTFEVWNDGCAYSFKAAELLEALDRRPHTDDEVERLCIDLLVVAGLIPQEEIEAEKAETMEALAQFFASGARDANLGRVFVQNIDRRQRLAREVDWSDLPPDEVVRARRTARYLLDHATKEGWVARSPDGERWQATDAGVAAIGELTKGR